MSWVQTYKGRKFDILNLSADEIDIEDIAHALSLQCRFNGHCKRFYSVAEHSVRASFAHEQFRIIAEATQEGDYQQYKKLGLMLLLHDASEAYFCDIPNPIKRQPYFEAYRILEKQLEAMIYNKYGITDHEIKMLHPYVKKVDIRMLLTEKRDLMATSPEAWFYEKDYAPYKSVIKSWLNPKDAEHHFLDRFTELFNQPETKSVL